LGKETSEETFEGGELEIEFPEQGMRIVLKLRGKGMWTRVHQYWQVEGFEDLPVYVFLKSAKEEELLNVHCLSLPADFILGKLLRDSDLEYSGKLWTV